MRSSFKNITESLSHIRIHLSAHLHYTVKENHWFEQ